MSMQRDGAINMAQSFNFNADSTKRYRDSRINPSEFHSWHRDNMYKSSYAKFHSANSVEPRNTAIPGYAGFIPGVKADNIHAKGYTNLAKTSFSSDRLAKNVFGLATTGFNVNKSAFIDGSKFGSSSKYGKSSLQRPHPNWDSSKWQSTTQQFFRNPTSHVNPTFRPTDKKLENTKMSTKSSGFATNHSYFDGKGWKPDPVLKGDNHRTEYRDLFNKPKDFHRSTFVDKVRKLNPKQLNYKLN